MSFRVDSYDVKWNEKLNWGMLTFTVVFQAGTGHDQTTHKIICPADEMALLVDLMRNEAPLYYDPATNVFSTILEPAGEGES